MKDDSSPGLAVLHKDACLKLLRYNNQFKHTLIKKGSKSKSVEPQDLIQTLMGLKLKQEDTLINPEDTFKEYFDKTMSNVNDIIIGTKLQVKCHHPKQMDQSDLPLKNLSQDGLTVTISLLETEGYYLIQFDEIKPVLSSIAQKDLPIF